MTIIQKGITFYVLLIFIIAKVNSICDVTFQSQSCAYDIYCNESTSEYDRSLNDFNKFVYTSTFMLHEDERNEDGVWGSIEEHCDLIVHNSRYSNNRFYPLHLTYRTFYQISEIPTYVVNTLITELDLSNNNYESIPTISKMDHLVKLNVSKNALNTAELSNFVELSKLLEIDLSHNNIKGVEYNNMYRYTELQMINLSYNYLTQLPDAVFDPFNDLVTLDLSHNYIEVLSPITFEGIKKLKHLNMSYNRISDINSSLFRFVDLNILNLSNNKIKTIKTTEFSQLINLKILDLNSNFISIIEKDSFHMMSSLQNLDLKNNKLEDIAKDLFENITAIHYIDLSENKFKTIPKNVFKDKMITDFSIENNQLEGSLEKGMFDGLAVTRLDLSGQNLGSIEDFAFYGISNLVVLLLNNNNISSLTINSFKTLNHLKRLDLSFNKIHNIPFAKDNLYNLFSLSLRNNYLTVIKQEDFLGLHSLQYLDLSDNKIRQVETKSLESFKELINFQISNNPLSGTLAEGTFDGLNSLPSLDISCTTLSSIQNGSFVGMMQLKKLNVSHSKIEFLEYNTFLHTGAIEKLDLSYNRLKTFSINSTELFNLDVLYLNNNLLKAIDSMTFKNILSLTELSLSYNMIEKINWDTFSNHTHMRILDLSFNSNLNLTTSLLNSIKTLDTLDLSGVKTYFSFDNILEISLKDVVFNNCNITDVKDMHLNEMRNIIDLNLSANEIMKLEIGCFDNITTVRNIDLSRNKIKEIPPGIFKDNAMLISLNISHNFLTALSYGMFRGLIYLSTLDVSYNSIKDLQNERFYEVPSLSNLMADHNKIESITADEFIGTSLAVLSIGGNPIPCDTLVNIKTRGVPFQITASKLYEKNEENVNGVTCNRKNPTSDKVPIVDNTNASDNIKVLLNIRDILVNHFKNDQTSKTTANIDDKYIINITDQIKTSNIDVTNKISKFLNSSVSVVTQNNETNLLLSKILRVLTLTSATRAPPVQITKENATYDNLVSYINKIKQDLEDRLKIDREFILNDMETKISAMESHHIENQMLTSTAQPKHEKLSVSDDSKSLFTETCVALILLILVGFVLFQVYKSGMFIRQRFSVSTRELPGSMDSPL